MSKIKNLKIKKVNKTKLFEKTQQTFSQIH